MKRFILLVFSALFLECSYAQDTIIYDRNYYDSIAVNTTFNSNIVEPKVFCVNDGLLIEIKPVSYKGMKTSGFIGHRTRICFDGCSSKNKIHDKILYVYIPEPVNGIYNIDNFRIVKLDPGYSERYLTTGVSAPFYVRTGVDSDVTTAAEVGVGWYRVSPASQISTGEYGIFYDYACGFPVKIFDFTIL